MMNFELQMMLFDRDLPEILDFRLKHDELCTKCDGLCIKSWWILS